MVDYVRAVGRAIRNNLCARPNINGFIAGQLADVRFSLGGISLPTTPSLIGSAAQAVLGTCPASEGPYQADGAAIAGGQCAGTYYYVKATGTVRFEPENLIYTVYWESGQGQNQGSIIGPIGTINKQNWNNYGGITGFGPPLEINSGNSGGIGGLNPVGNDQGNRTNFQGGNNTVLSAVITSIQSVGGPDNCGNTSSTGGSGNGAATLNYDGPDGTAQTNIIDISYSGSVIGINGDVRITGRATGPLGPINFTIDPFSGEVNIGGPGSGGDDGAGSYPPTPEVRNPPAPGDEPPPPDDGNGIFMGVIVTANSAEGFGSATQLDGGDGPLLLVPRIGTINFGLDLDGVRAWSEPLDVKNKLQYIQCPYPGGAVSVRGYPISGVTFAFTPVYVEVPSDLRLI